MQIRQHSLQSRGIRVWSFICLRDDAGRRRWANYKRRQRSPTREAPKGQFVPFAAGEMRNTSSWRDSAQWTDTWERGQEISLAKSVPQWAQRAKFRTSNFHFKPDSFASRAQLITHFWEAFHQVCSKLDFLAHFSAKKKDSTEFFAWKNTSFHLNYALKIFFLYNLNTWIN